MENKPEIRANTASEFGQYQDWSTDVAIPGYITDSVKADVFCKQETLDENESAEAKTKNFESFPGIHSGNAINTINCKAIKDEPRLSPSKSESDEFMKTQQEECDLGELVDNVDTPSCTDQEQYQEIEFVSCDPRVAALWPEDLKQPIKKEHEDDSNLQGGTSGSRFRCPKKSSLKRHTVSEHIKQDDCNLCHFNAESEGALRAHNTYKRDKKLFKCDQCDYSSVRKHDLKVHIMGVHSKDRAFTCKLCDYSTAYKSNLKGHISGVHGTEKPFTCNLCNYSTAYSSNLKGHISGVHGTEKPFTCKLCGFSTAYKAKLKAHTRGVHSTEKPFTCNLCEYSTVFRPRLKRHIRCAHSTDKPFTCDKCNYSTAVKGNLTGHIISKHSESRPFTCNKCNYASVRRGNLRRHILCRHSGNIPFTCNLCDYTTAYKSKLEMHVKCVHVTGTLFTSNLFNINLHSTISKQT